MGSHFFLNYEFKNPIEIDEEENFTEYYLKVKQKASDFKNPTSKIIGALIQLVYENDKLEIEVKLDGVFLSKLVYQSIQDIEEIKEFIRGIQEEKQELVESDSIFETVINIQKENINNSLAIYKYSAFMTYLLKLSLEGLYYSFNKLFLRRENINFEVRDPIFQEEQSIYTERIHIGKLINKKNSKITQSRDELLLRRNSVCNFINASQYRLIPNDFHILKQSRDPVINNIFKKICFFVTASFICDISSIEGDNSFYFKINGYKSIENTIDFRQLNVTNGEDLYRIYEWIYFEGSVSDKVGLVRNIISLQLPKIESNNITISENLLGSVLSSYEIYLKENVKQYIEVKNKVSEFLIENSIRTTELIRRFTSSLRGTNYLFATFFFTTIVFSTLSANREYIFTKEIAYLAYAVLFISFLYLLASIGFIIMETKRFTEQFERLKRLYGDLLNEDDLENIFLVDEHNNDKNFIENKAIIISSIWFLEVIILYIVVLILEK